MEKFYKNKMFNKSRIAVLVGFILMSLSVHAGNNEYYYLFTEFHPYPTGAGKIYVSKTKEVDADTISTWNDSFVIEECKYCMGGADYYLFGKPEGDYVIAGVSTGKRADELSDWGPTVNDNGDVVISNQENPFRYTPTSSIHDKDSMTCVSMAPMFPTHCAYLVFTKVAAKVAEGYKNFGSVTCSKVANETGDKISIEAKPADERCHFTHWVKKSNGEKLESNPLDIEVGGSEEYYAYFSCDSATVINEPDGKYMLWYSNNSSTITGPGSAESYSFAQDSLGHTENGGWFVEKKVNTNDNLYTSCPLILYVKGEVFVCSTPQYNSIYNLAKPLAQWSGDNGVSAQDISNDMLYYVVDIEGRCFNQLTDLTGGIAAKTMYLALSKSTFDTEVPAKIYWSREDASTASGITSTEMDKAMKNGKIYNINGMEVKSVGRNGIYIIDGKKVIQRNN